MGVLEDIVWALTHPFTSPMPDPLKGEEIKGSEQIATAIPEQSAFFPARTDTDDPNAVQRARNQLKLFLLGLVAVVGAPTGYALWKSSRKGKKRSFSERDMIVGVNLENTSSQATGVLLTAIASPAISTAASYILVQKLEDANVISKGLGNAAQALLTVSAAGPAIQGVGQIAGSAFKAFKPVK